MKKVTSYLLLLFMALVVNGCFVTSRMRAQAPKSYTSVWDLGGLHQYITLNDINHQFYYYGNGFLSETIIGTWEVCKDTLYLHPALMYEAHRGELVTTLINEDDYEKEDYCPLKFLMRGKKSEMLEDITDYSDVVSYTFWYKLYKDSLIPEQHRDSFFIKHSGEDSIIPVHNYKWFILSSDFKKLWEKWGKMEEKKEQKNEVKRLRST